MLRGDVYTLILYLYTLTLNLNPNFFKLIITLIPTLIPITMAPTKSPTEKKWATIASKYGYRINTEKTLKDELVKFIQTIIYLYKT